MTVLCSMTLSGSAVYLPDLQHRLSRLCAPTPAVRAELSLLFSYSCNYADYQEALDLLGRGAIDPGPLLSQYPLESAHEAFEAVSKGQAVKAVLVP